MAGLEESLCPSSRKAKRLKRTQTKNAREDRPSVLLCATLTFTEFCLLHLSLRGSLPYLSCTVLSVIFRCSAFSDPLQRLLLISHRDCVDRGGVTDSFQVLCTSSVWTWIGFSNPAIENGWMDDGLVCGWLHVRQTSFPSPFVRASVCG